MDYFEIAKGIVRAQQAAFDAASWCTMCSALLDEDEELFMCESCGKRGCRCCVPTIDGTDFCQDCLKD